MRKMPNIVEADKMRKFARCEITYEELTGGRKEVTFDEYELTLDDLVEAMKNMRARRMSREEFAEGWFYHVYYDLFENYGLQREEETHEMPFILFDTEPEILLAIHMWCNHEHDMFRYKHVDGIPDYRMVIKTIETYRANLSKTPSERRFTLAMKFAAVSHIGNPDKVESLNKEQKSCYRKFLNDLVKYEVPLGLRISAYLHLFGLGKIYPVNRAIAKRQFIRYYEITEDTFIASIIGDLYYSVDGEEEPDYVKAYQYYTISALDGNVSSLLKTSDMLIRGLGTVKNYHVGKMLVFNCFDDAYKDFCRFNFNSYLVDVTVRMAMIFERGYDVKPDIMEAAKFYNIAKYALHKRIERNHRADEADLNLYADICARCRELSSEIGSNPNASYVFSEVPNMLLACMVENYEVIATITKEKGEYKLVTRRLPKINEDRAQGVLIEYPLNEYCALVEEVEEYMPVRGTKIWLEDDETNTFVADEMSYNKERKECTFRHRGDPVARIKTSMFSCRLKPEN